MPAHALKPSTWSKGTKVTAGAAGWLMSILGAVWAASADHSAVIHQATTNRANLEHTQRDVTDHEERIRRLEAQLPAIAADVRWIRATLEAQHTTPRQP